TQLAQGIVSADPQNPSIWNSLFPLLVDPTLVNSFSIAPNSSPALLAADASQLKAFQGTTADTANPGFVYDPTTKQLGFQYQMCQSVRSLMEGPLEIIKLDSSGNPV